MRLPLLALLLLCAAALAEERPLRFSVTESWAMPMMQIEHGQATAGILYDLQMRLAEKVGRRAELMVMPRLRVQQMLVRGEIDVRCYVNPAWLSESHYQYIWSVPFMIQPDVLVRRANDQPVPVEQAQGALVGTVLGFIYPKLEPLFASGHLRRDDARTQALALEKLEANRYRYAVSNDLALQWYNRRQPPARQLQEAGELSADLVACIVRDAPDVPTMQLLRALVQMSNDGEFTAILAKYR
ncbi:amino acid ABC transporter substrate-binding protein [Pseudomonas alcaligenes]|uniref:Amino acid ABC transporter substrate-binding protein n=1 Tax=Aquipseudomonas alcaligenes TaxID=43263 RepID=A0ABR7S1T4_AQUAC|nr:transporter substrate-binding domain-containing protein [Pseudomonas alcaligenes]MBC9251545.1 amino acid ABC transporter substrate-binding protein [Pseudomonas alcaligenes]